MVNTESFEIHSHTEFLEAEYCHAIIEYFRSLEKPQASPMVRSAKDLLQENPDKLPGNVDLHIRNSTSVRVSRGRLNAIDKLYERTVDILDCAADAIEDIQIVHYEPGAYFRPHFDAGEGLERKMTLLVYLNEGFDGGLTYFPNFRAAIVPKTGLAVSFPNLDYRGEVIPEALHESTELLTGEKFACNVWVHSLIR